MKRFLAPFLLIGLAGLFCAPGALADSEHANANSQGHASETTGNDQGNNGNGQGNSASDDTESPADATPDAVAPAPASTDQDAALDAVKSGKAVPLETIVGDVKQKGDGEVLDAHQVTARGFLLYEIKVLEPDGKVTNLYYYARSGQPVGR